MLVTNFNDIDDMIAACRENHDITDVLFNDIPIAFIDDKFIMMGDQIFVADRMLEVFDQTSHDFMVRVRQVGQAVRERACEFRGV